MPKRIQTYRPAHLSAAKVKRSYETAESRRADKRFYASGAWLRLRDQFLAEHPLCNACYATNQITAAAHVHHLKERKDHPELALDWDNLEALCQPCHNRKRRRL